MSIRESKTVSFTPEQASFVDQCVQSGRYLSASEVVREGLRLLLHEEEKRKASLESVRSMIEKGAEELDNDDVVDGETVFRRLRARREKLRREVKASA